MDHMMNYAFQACSSNEERQSLEAATNASAAQQWMHSNSQFNMHEQYPPYFSTTHSLLRPSSQLPMQQITEEPGAMVGASTGNKSCKVKLKNFSSDEDVNLTKWWLAISTDPVVNTGQRKEGFWSRITKGYNSTLGVYPERSHKLLMNRWDHIKESCTKFGDIHAAILRANPSGMSDADKTTEAVARFADTQPKPFNLMHCWKYLKDEPKWQETICDQSKPIDVEDDCYVTPAGGSNQVDIDGEGSTPCSGGSKRPLGRDSTKESRKKSASSSESSEYVSKMQDLWMDRLSFMKESQAEKNKHLAEMAVLEKEKIDRLAVLEKERLDRQVELEERRLVLDARRLAKEERADESRMLAEEERILSIDLDTCKPGLRVFYKAQQDKILAKYSAPPP